MPETPFMNVTRRLEARDTLVAVLEKEIDRLRAIEKTARDYYLGYVQDEAAEWEVCISEVQHEHAKALRDALGEK